jgi:hypothetical protein
LLNGEALLLRLPPQEIRLEQDDDEQHAQCHGGGLGKKQPEFAHVDEIQRFGVNPPPENYSPGVGTFRDITTLGFRSGRQFG